MIICPIYFVYQILAYLLLPAFKNYFEPFPAIASLELFIIFSYRIYFAL